MRGKVKAFEREAASTRSSAFMVAALMRAEKLPDADEWVTGKKNRQAEIRRWVAAWDKVDAALARNS